MVGTTLKDTIDDDENFIKALKVLNIFAEKSELNDKANSADVYTNTLANTTFVKAAEFKTKAAEVDVVKAILGAKENNKSILVEKLGTFLDEVDETTQKVYGQTGHEKIAKDYLAEKYPLAKIDASNLTDATNQKAFAEKILGAKENNKSILVEKLGTFLDEVDETTQKVYGQTGHEKIAKDYLAEKYPLAKIDASNLTDATNQKAFAEKILGAKENNKSILVEKLGTFLDDTANPYGTSNNQSAKDFLADKGMKPTPNEVANVLINETNKNTLTESIVKSVSLQADLAKSQELKEAVKTALIGDKTFTQAVRINLSAEDPAFRKAVNIVKSETHYDMPSSENDPLNWHIPFSDLQLV